jgi:hypothetical protein
VSGASYVLIFSSIVCAAVGVISIAVAARERGRGSATWAWLLPGVAGVLLLGGCVIRLVIVVA